jgi:hypothetical protein
MDDQGERVDLLAADEDVDARQIARLETCEVVVEARVPARARLQLVVEVEDDLAERKLVHEQDAVLAQVLEMVEAPTPLVGELHDRSDVVLRDDDRRLDERLLDLVELARHLRRVVHLDDLARSRHRPVCDVRRRDQEVEVELALEALADDLHVQKPENPQRSRSRAPATSPARRRGPRR